MATERMDDQSQAPGLSSIAHSQSIAKVIFHDGRSMCFPSIASVTSNSSIPTTPSPFRSRSSSRRGRPKASSFSSTSSVRDQLGCFGMGGIDDCGTDHTVTAAGARPAPIAQTSRQNSNPLDYVSVGEDWDSTATLRPDSDWMEINQEPTIHNQDQLVAGAEGAGDELPRQYDDMSKTLHDMLMQDNLSDFDQTTNADNSFRELPAPSSAPSAPSWIHRARRQDSISSVAPSFAAEIDPSYDFDGVSNGKPARKPGRIPGSKLPEEKRRKVAVMRNIGACTYCKKGRRGCDPGTPCKPCILHFGADVLERGNHCRYDIVDRLTTQILSEQCKWHPYPREMTDFFGRDFYITTWCVEIPIQFGFGPCFRRLVQLIETSTSSHLQHEHQHYPPPAQSGTPYTARDFVLPVTFTATSDLHIAIDEHIEMLVDEHLREFNFFNSRFKILHSIHKLFLHYRQTNNDYSSLLRQALKLLVLIHCSDVIVPTDDPSVGQILQRFAPGYLHSQNVTPCILRAELGRVVPQLARILLDDVLKRMLRICLVRRCDQHPVVIATFSLLMMTIESVMYHSARIGFHAHTSLSGPATSMPGERESFGASQNPFASTTNPIETMTMLQEIDKAASSLHLLYLNCFEDCHTVLLRPIEHRRFTSLQKSFGEVPAHFIAALNQAIRDASGYIEMRGSEKVEDIHDISHHFDRLLSKLFLLQTDPINSY